ncbi:MAG: TrkH family potassium uptake protein [Duncaniella sp.]|nr:TrkH family potassium uptake protein [Duncaniella sp.]
MRPFSQRSGADAAHDRSFSRRRVHRRLPIPYPTFESIRKLWPVVNFPAVLRIIGLLLMIEGGFMLIPLGVCLLYQEPDFEGFAVAAGAALGAGALMAFGIKPERSHMAKREGFLLTALVWVFFSAFGMIPFMMMGRPLSVSDAFFEAMSGFTTTGASVMDSICRLSHGIIIWRALMQWIGGMGIILFTLAVIPMLNRSGGIQMFNAEVTGITHDKLRPRISQTAKSLWAIYICLTLALFGLLVAGPMDIFTSVCYAFSTMSTGGFSTSDAGDELWHSDYLMTIVTCFMFLGGVSFTLLYRLVHGEFRKVWANDVFRYFVAFILVFYLLFLIPIYQSGAPLTVRAFLLEPLFQIISFISSTGYTVPSFASWGAFVLALVFILLFFGACAGSTSGGAKIDRLIFLLKNCRNEIVRSIYPNNILTVRVNGRVIPHDVIAKVVAFLCLYVLIIAVGGIVLCALNVPLIDAFFSAFTCISNTGLQTGITGYGQTFSIIPDAGKWVLALIMLIGRLELFTVLILFSPSFWRK